MLRISSILARRKGGGLNLFINRVAALASGVASAQIISLVFMPMITRIYGPEVYGGLGFYSSLVSFVVPLLGLCYPLAIILPKHDSEARLIGEASVKISLLFIVIFSFLVFLISRFDLVHFPFSHELMFLAFGAWSSFLVVIFTQFCIRKGRFKQISLVLVLSAFVGGLAKVLIGVFFATAEVLISVTIAASVFQSIALGHICGINVFNIHPLLGRKRHWAVLRKLKRFPVYRLPHTTVATLSQLMPVFLLTYFFGSAAAGYFVLTRATLAAPVTLIGKSVYNVAYPTINQRRINKEGNFNFIVSLTLIMLTLSIIPLTIFIIYGEAIFSLAFGEEWRVSGTYASVMSVWFAFNLCNKACSASVSVYNLDGFLFYNGLLNIGLSSFGFFVGVLFFGSDVVAVSLFALFGVACQIILMSKVVVVVKRLDDIVPG